MTNDMIIDMAKDGAPGQAPAVHEEPAGCDPVAAAPVSPPASASSPSAASPPSAPLPDVAETSEPPTREDVRRFRLATLRARLALLGVAFDPSTDEATLRRMLRAAEGQGGGAARPGPKNAQGSTGTAGAIVPTGPASTTDPAGHAADPAPTTEPGLTPSVAMRRATARHLRERQRVAAEDTGASGVTGSSRTGGGRPRGRGRS
ncbi:hypothetical protein [Nitratidesulfovibrio sp. SRB-5]|uniref:hypothetical protein n=1 Tax=Nitratidesulfovibrio sp. SRB-5 TaxID=2872636 RepID=UPI001CBD0C85|nr:hypothetical protein [Nitratidesulfovibrio sp. SRB-5]MBZ2172729.1 hypothetical protein [Nitratidesulfovibrio sp. SRB-5]